MFTSDQKPFMADFNVSLAGTRAEAKQPFDFSPEIRKPTVEPANNSCWICGSGGHSDFTIGTNQQRPAANETNKSVLS